MARSACGPAGLVSVAWLLPGTGSVLPKGGLTVAVLISWPVVPAGTVPLTVKVAWVPTGGVTTALLSSGPVVPAGTVPLTVNVAWVPAGSVTSASMSPVPLGVPQLAPTPLGVQVQANPASAAGSASCTRALVTLLGPT